VKLTPVPSSPYPYPSPSPLPRHRYLSRSPAAMYPSSSLMRPSVEIVARCDEAISSAGEGGDGREGRRVVRWTQRGRVPSASEEEGGGDGEEREPGFGLRMTSKLIQWVFSLSLSLSLLSRFFSFEESGWVSQERSRCAPEVLPARGVAR